MKEYDYYAVADRVQLTDERTALESLKRLLPDYRQYKSFYEFWKDCTKRAERNNSLLSVPLSLLKEYENEHDAFAINYAIVRLLKSLADFEYAIQLGIDYTELDKVEQCIIAAAEYLSKSQEFLYFDSEHIMHIRYRKDYLHVKDIYIVEVDGHLCAKVPTLIDDIALFVLTFKLRTMQFLSRSLSRFYHVSIQNTENGHSHRLSPKMIAAS